jgi:hypothetical protein
MDILERVLILEKLYKRPNYSFEKNYEKISLLNLKLNVLSNLGNLYCISDRNISIICYKLDKMKSKQEVREFNINLRKQLNKRK